MMGPIIALAFIAVSISLNPWFTWADNALSDLGAIGESYNIIFNLGLILSGIAGVLFVLHLPKLTNGKMGTAGVITIGAGMISLILIGVFPSGTAPHWSVSIGFYGLSAFGMSLIGIDQVRRGPTRPWGILLLSILFLAIASIGLISTIPYELGAAIPEVIGAIAISEFSIAFGARLLTT